MKSEFHLLIRNNNKELIPSINAVNRFLENQALPPKVVYHANLVFEEILTNIFKYAFQDACEHQIHVQLSLTRTNLIMEFVDDGQQFNPLSVPPPKRIESITDCTEGGLGLHLVRQVVEWIQYQRDNNQNVLRMSINWEC